MAHQSTASVGSTALDVIEDPALADEVGVTSGGRVANLRGQSSPEDSCDNKPKDALVRNSSEDMTAENMSPTQHAALQVPAGRTSRTPQEVHDADVQRARFLEQQRQRSGLHWSPIPWLQVAE